MKVPIICPKENKRSKLKDFQRSPKLTSNQKKCEKRLPNMSTKSKKQSKEDTQFCPKEKKKCKEKLSKKSPKAALNKIKSVKKIPTRDLLHLPQTKKCFQKQNSKEVPQGHPKQKECEKS
jgi:hypothetical protein